jgi:hypothetical protein
MTQAESSRWQDVAYRMDAEGFHYCFRYYSSFEKITDPEFHRLREAYLAAAAALETYVGRMADTEPDECAP